MAQKPSLLETVEVTSPCSQNWETMPGDDQQRLCAACDRNVFDLSVRTRTEAEFLLQTHANDRLCVRLRQAQDGTIVTRERNAQLDRFPIRLLSYGLAVCMLLASAPFWVMRESPRHQPSGSAAPTLRDIEPIRTVMEWLDPSPRTFQKVSMGMIATPQVINAKGSTSE
jgi:hypothetical protein